MLSHKDIDTLLNSQDTMTLIEYRQATTPVTVQLSGEMASALGTPNRRLVPFLATAVEVIAGKLEIDDRAIKANRAKLSKEIQHWLGDQTWSLIERELYSAAVRDGTAFVLTTWENGAPKFTVREAYNGVCGAHVVEEDEKPIYAWNYWQFDGISFVDFYYPERIEKYIKGSGERDEWQPRTDAPDEPWPLLWVDDNGQPLGIAITEFSIGGSDIADALQIGRDMNEAILDLIATSRTQGWPQKWIKGQRNPGVLTNDLGQPIVSGTTGRPLRYTVQATPGSILQLSDSAELGQLAPATPDPTVLDKLLELLSFVTAVPSHYLNGQWPSGVALIQAESRLNHKVEEHQGRLSGAIATMLRLATRLSNHFGGTAYDPEQPIDIPWHSPEIETEDLKRERQAFQQDSMTKLVEAGLMSKEIAVRELHPEWSEEELTAELVRLGIAQEVQQ